MEASTKKNTKGARTALKVTQGNRLQWYKFYGEGARIEITRRLPVTSSYLFSDLLRNKLNLCKQRVTHNIFCLREGRLRPDNGVLSQAEQMADAESDVGLRF